MKTFQSFAILAIALTVGSLYPETSVSRIDQMIRERRYLTALNEIRKEDPDSNNLELFIRKLDLCLNYNVRWLQGMDSFSLTDLLENETVEDLRNRPPVRAYPLYTWDIKPLLESKIQQNPPNEKLQILSAQYYAQVCFAQDEWQNIKRDDACDKSGALYSKLLDQTKLRGDICESATKFLLNSKKIPEAKNRLDVCLHANPRNSKLLIIKAVMFQEVGELKEAEKTILQAVSVASTPADKSKYMAFAATMSFQNKEFNVAATRFYDAYKFETTNLNYFAWYIESLLRAGNLDSASRAYASLLSAPTEPHPSAINGVRAAYERADKSMEYAKLIPTLQAQNAKRPFIRIVLLFSGAITNIELKRTEEASAQLDQVDKLMIGFTHPYKDLAVEELARIRGLLKTRP